MSPSLVLLIIFAILFILLLLHSKETVTEGFTETETKQPAYTKCEELAMSAMEPQKLGAALQMYHQRTGLPACSTLDTQPVTNLELRNDGNGAGSSFGWKIFWKPLAQNIKSYTIKMQYEGGCPAGVQTFELPGDATEFELPQPLRPRLRFVLRANSGFGTPIGSDAMVEFVIPHWPNKGM
nr:hypothetical protein MarFTME_431 [Marseillevirus futianmevirus]